MNHLPDELLLHIFKSIHQLGLPHHLSKTLANVCLVSRKFHRIATPVLYETLMRVVPNTRHATKASVFYRFLKTLQARPEFRPHVKRLLDLPCRVSSDEIAPRAGTIQDKPVPLLPSDYMNPEELIAAVANELEILNTTTLFIRYHAGEDICLMLCALLAPNLEHAQMFIRGRSTEGTSSSLLLEYLGHSVLSMPVGKVHNFDKLRRLQFEPDFTLAFPVTHAFPLVLLPHLEHLTLGAWGAVLEDGGYILDPNDSTVFGRPWTWPLGSSNISELSLQYPFTTSELVCRMIQACKSLTKFECIAIDSISVVGRQNHWWYNHIASALQAHRNTLREINVGEEFSPITSPHGHGRLRSLQNMTCLIRLRVPWQILLGHDGSVALPAALPQSIEELTIELYNVPDDTDYEAAFVELHKACNTGGFAAFRSIHLLWRITSIPMHFAFDVARVQSLYTTGHVRFDLTIQGSDMLKPAPLVLRRYEQLFPAYTRYKYRNDLGRHVQQRHFVQASTCFRSEKEHEELMTGLPAW